MPHQAACLPEKIGHLKKICMGKVKHTVAAEDVEALGIVVAAMSKAPAQPQTIVIV